MAIPKTIHYCWFGGKDIPKQFQEYINEWKVKCPDYEIVRWDESNYDIEKNLFIKKAYDEKKWAFVSDYVRIDVVNQYGGIYLDTDVQIVKKFDDLLNNKSFFGIERTFTRDLLVNTGLGFGSEKNNKILVDILDLYKNIAIEECYIPCPVIQLPIFKKYGFVQKNKHQNLNDNLILPTEYLSPKNPLEKIRLTKNTYSIHHYSATWTDGKSPTKMYKRCAYFFGEPFGEILYQIIRHLFRIDM